jgi:outer membrane protein TolC
MPVSVDDHVAAAQRLEAGATSGDPGLAAFEARIKAIMDEWNERLARPERMPLIADFGSPENAGLRKAAASPSFPATLAEQVTERQLVVSAFERNPRIRAAFLKLRAAVNQYAQVTYLDTILSQYAAFQRTSRTRVGTALAGEGMDQSFPFPGSLELKAALVKHSVEEARARYAGAVRDIVVETRVLFARYVFVGRALHIAEVTLQYLKQLEDAARSRLEAGTGTKGAVIQVQVEVSSLRNEIVTLHQDRLVLQADIARLLDVASDTAIGPPVPSSLPDAPQAAVVLRQDAMTHQPEIESAQARVRRMQTMIELAEQTTYPAISAGLSTMEGTSHATGGSDKDREPFDTRPKIKPDPWFGTKEAYLREAREAARAAEARAQAARNKTVFAVQSALTELQTAQRLYRLYRDVQLAQAEQAYRDAASGYSAGRVEFLNVVDSLRRWLRFQLEADRAARDIHISNARLEGAVGRRTPEEGK